jgi:cytoplasmic iron level regulating protein YaaA (DUF328/UPF0246 family)
MVGIRRIFDLKRQQIIKNWQKLSSEDLQALYLLPDVIREINQGERNKQDMQPTWGLMIKPYNIFVTKSERQRPL